jgi:ubiquinone/menaquinone biosynthesis C-methylase UbiE
MTELTDLDRLRTEYANRKKRLAGKNFYSLFYIPYLFAIQHRQRNLVKKLKQNGFSELKGKRILEVGCGGGGVLIEYLTLGADPEGLFGIDLLMDRLVEAHHKLPLSVISCADGQNLPYPSDSFDLVLQYTAFSSLLDTSIKRNVANEMMRVTKRGGMILWYDFWVNPTNRQTRGITPAEIRLLFPNCRYEFHRITLAPPIARKIVPISWGLASLLDSLKFFNSHYLATIQPL